MNKYKDHVYVIPEDDADRQIADGFVLHHRIDSRQIQVMPIARGWPNVLSSFRDEYIQILRNNPRSHVVMIIDFDGHTDDRRAKFENEVPEQLRARVFVVGAKDTPEILKNSLKLSFEKIGIALAVDCDEDTTEHWDHEQLRHNDAERKRLVQTVKPFLFVP